MVDQIFTHVIAPPEGSTLLDGLAAWWPMQEASGTPRLDVVSTNDLTGGYEAVAQGTGHVEAFCADIFRSTETLNYALGIAEEDLTFSFSSTYSMMLWIQPGTHTTYNRGICGKHHTNFRLDIFGTTSGNPGLIIFQPSGTDAYLGFVDEDEWSMIVVTFDPTGDTSGSLNGAALGTIATVNPTSPNGEIFWIGMDSTGATLFGGLVGPVAVWDRLLDNSEVAELWNGGAGLAYGDI